MSSDLARLEQWMLAVVTHPDGVIKGIDEAGNRVLDVSCDTIESVILPSKNLTAIERLEVYADMYFWRLVDILAADFPATRHAMGHDEFYDVGVDYLVANPSRNYRLTPMGEAFPRFIQSDAKLGSERDFLAQIARLERRMEEVFDEAHQTPLTPLEVQAVPPENWDITQFRTIAALRLEKFDFPVNRYLNSFKKGDEPAVPDREPTQVVIWRMDYDIWRSELTPAQFVILSALSEGLALGDALERCADLPDFDPESLLANLGPWFTEFTSDGLFYAVACEH